MSQRFYRPELDALRFFAFACVFIFHLPARSETILAVTWTGALGVSIFFLLSAYLIVTLLLREREATGTIRLGAFFARRVLRIWPLYFAVIFAAYLLGCIYAPAHISAHAVMALSLLAGNLYIVNNGWTLVTINALWSVSVEEQFYLAVPAITRAGGRRALTVVCIVAIIGAYVTIAWLGRHGEIATYIAWANSFVQFQFFAAGGLIAVLLNGRALSYPLLPRMGVLCLGLALWSLATVRYRVQSPEPASAEQLGVGYLFVLVGTVLIFLAVAGASVRVPAVIRYLGKISYGLYVFHQFWLWLFFIPRNDGFTSYFITHEPLGIVLALAGTLLSAMLSYHYFESPILRFKNRFEVIRTRPA
jgi:peptidoglycan/LPS O-acetylase OafA/YrhL